MHPLEALLTPLGKVFRKRHADEAQSLSHAPELATETHFSVTSAAFRDGEEIPAKFCGPLIGENVSPALAWSGLPAGTAELVLLMEDIGSPGVVPRVHTVAAFAPIDGGLPEGALVAGAPGITYVPRDKKPPRYVGPRPLPGHGPHVYRFHLYALDTAVDLSAVADPSALPAALAGHVLGSGMMTGSRTA